MLRMASRIATTGLSGVRAASIIGSDEAHQALAHKYLQMQGEASDATVLVADNVAEFYASHPQMEWEFETDFPNCVPITKPLLVEFQSPDSILMGKEWKQCTSGMVACLVNCEEVDDKLLRQLEAAKRHGMDLSIPPAAKWILRIDTLMFAGGSLMLSDVGCILPLDGKGTPLRGPNCTVTGALPSDASWLADYINAVTSILHVPLLAMSFANCRNVVRRDVTAEVGPPAKWIRRQKAPEIRYHVLDINPMKEVLRTEGGIEANGLKKALHICRGHFAHYENGLFGRGEAVTIWKPSHVRGSVEHGIVDKDYRIKVGT